jgi:hypothetical protein
MPYHHYIAAFHLAEFSSERERSGQLYVFDLEQSRTWRTTVSRAGGETGYNAVQGVPDLDPEAIEQLLGRYETAAAPVLRSVNDTLMLPRGDELDALLQYVALLSANNPARRRAMNDTQEQMLYFMAKMMLGRPETFEAAQAECRRDGVPLIGEISYQQLQALVEDGLSYSMPNVAHLRGMGNIVDFLVSMLQERTWSILIAPPEVSDFICGDRPVVLTWTAERAARLEAAAEGEMVPPPGFAMPDTELIVPLGRRVTLVGVIGGDSRRLRGDQEIIGEANRRMLRHATRFVYSAEEHFTFRDPHGNLRDSSALLAE